MPPLSDDILFNLTCSLDSYLRTQVLTKSAVNKTLLAWYASPLLSIVLDFPDLEGLSLPTLALQWVSNPTGQSFYGGLQANDYFFTLWGFAGGETTETKNKVQRDKLIGDCTSLLEGAAIPMFAWSNGVKGAEIGTVQITGKVSSQSLPKTGQTEAEKYRFSANFTARLLENIF